jgi:HK97 family phage prohead protease
MAFRIDLPAEIKLAVDVGEGVITGLASAFGNVDLHGDTIAPGAFTKALQKVNSGERKVAMLDHHRMDAPVGKWTQFRETDRGLEIQGRLTMGVNRARELYELAKDGALGGLSIGFRTVKDRMDQDRKTRIIEEVDLFEVSLVSIPANPMAKIEAVKLAPEIETRRDFERALREHFGFTANQAKSIASGGWRGEARDEPSDCDLSELRKAVEGLKALSGAL